MSLETDTAEFAKKIALSDFVNESLREAMNDLQTGSTARFVREARRFGLSDAQIGILIHPEPPSPIQ